MAAWWAAKHPNRTKRHPGRTRLPKFFPIVGWLLVGVGAFMSLVAFTVSEPELEMQIAGVLMLAGGLAFLLMYRNFYVAPGPENVHFRTVMGRENVIAYADIREVRSYHRNGQPYVKVMAADGTTLDLNPAMYDLSAMFDYLEGVRVRPAQPFEEGPQSG